MRRSLSAALLAAATTVVFALLATAPAGAYVYWTHGESPGLGWIGRVNLDGTGVDARFLPTLSASGGLAAAGGKLYWTNPDAATIGRASVDGTDADQRFITLPDADAHLGDVAAGEGSVYWSWTAGTWRDPSSGVGSATLDGDDVDQDLVRANVAESVYGLATSGPYLFWITAPAGCCPTITRASADGTPQTEIHFGDGKSNGGTPRWIAADDTHLYFDSYLGFGRMAFDGSGAVFFGAPASPLFGAVGAVAADSSHMYWTNSDGTIGRNTPDLGGSEPAWIHTRAEDTGDHPFAIAVDDAGPTAITDLRLGHHRVRHRTRVAYRTDKGQTVTFTLARLLGGRGRRDDRLRGQFVRRPTRAGTDRFRLHARWQGRRLRPGRYRLTATPSADGGTAPAATTRFRVLHRRPERREPRHKGGAPAKRSG